MRLVVLVLAAIGLVGAAPVDWTRRVAVTPTGSYVLGNPAAKVRLVEYLSYTCPHCAHFAKESAVPLRQSYIRTGKVSVELRNAVRDGLDLTAAILVHCGPPASFFARHEAVFANQEAMFAKIEAWQAANPAPATMDAAVKAFAGGAGLSGLMVRQGIPIARQNQCLADPKLRAMLVAQTKEAFEVRKIDGTPTFLLDGEQFGGTWATVEPKLRAKVK
ncbi:MAG TPA: thioredoxin domain-containing protein [Sphingomonas sp.]|jgi:protein-disulfide isomerase|nr:thioredoxin domain-containing protein [Sphingomonas sp.]